MGHEADSSFFESKRPWSERKDLILGYYLKPYLPKVAQLRKPILIVDGFAGPGKFGDGKSGSPVIICDAISTRPPSMATARIKAIFIEKNQALHSRLSVNVQDRVFAQTRCMSFLDVIDEIYREAQSSTTFLYLDPFTVQGLQWAALQRVFGLLTQGVSVEVLLNLNVDSFCRRGLAALAKPLPVPSAEIPEQDDQGPTEVSTLNTIAGGDWWQKLLSTENSYPEKTAAVLAHFCEMFKAHFAEVCFHEVRELSTHRVPKYVLVFGSRHPHALLLMNEAMCKSRQLQADSEQPPGGTLFEMRSESLVPDSAKLPALIESLLSVPSSRFDLVLTVIRRAFCQYSESEIKQSIYEMVKSGRIHSSTGTKRPNDDAILKRRG